MRPVQLFLAFLVLQIVPPQSAQAQAFAECGFGFDIDTQSSAFQAMIIDGEEKRGFWLSINRAPSDVRAVAKYIGRLQVCLTTIDGKSRSFTRNGRTITLDSPFVTNCTAALLPGNRLLTNHHCFYDPDLNAAGFTVVREARVNFLYTSKDDTGGVRTYLVAPSEVKKAEDYDAMVLQVLGGDPVGDLGGHIKMSMLTEVEPFQELRLIHHPGAEPQQYSAGTCQVHRRQEEIPAERSPFRHTCESTGGSSGSLLFDARTLAVVALHNQGGLSQVGDSFNGGHKIAMVNDALELGFEPISTAPPPPSRNEEAQAALVAALLLIDNEDKRLALEKVVADYAGTGAARQAERALRSLANVAGPVKPPEVTPPETRPGETPKIPVIKIPEAPPEEPETPPVEPPQIPVIVTPPPQEPPPQPPELTLVERMLADPDVQRCDTLAGSPSHPDRLTGAMVAPGRPFAEIDGIPAAAACRAALAKFPEHPRLLSFLGDALFRAGQEAEGVAVFRRSAEQGDPTALTSLGFLHKDGRGVTLDYNQARAYFEQAVAMNYPLGFTGMGILYRDGHGVARNYNEAFAAFTRGANGGDPIAMAFVAELYEFGRGTGQDPARAAAFYMQALEGGVEWIITKKRTWDGATARAVQTKLRELGYYTGAIDGAIGPGTRAAMERMRQDSLNL